MNYPKKEIEIGEWQTDENGRRFRWEGNIKSYEMMVNIGGAMVPESQVEAFNARNKEAAAAHIKAMNEAAAKAQERGACPFRENGSISMKLCDDNCALFTPDGCGLVHTRSQAGKAYPDKKTACPFSHNRTCSPCCALYKDGCLLAAR